MLSKQDEKFHKSGLCTTYLDKYNNNSNNTTKESVIKIVIVAYKGINWSIFYLEIGNFLLPFCQWGLQIGFGWEEVQKCR